MSHVLIEVPDIDAASAFYAALFGFDGRLVGSERLYFHYGSLLFGVVDAALTAQGSAPLSGPYYLAVDDLEALHARARALECLSEEEIEGVEGGQIAVRLWGERSFYAVDPFGNRLCFVDEGTVFTGS